MRIKAAQFSLAFSFQVPHTHGALSASVLWGELGRALVNYIIRVHPQISAVSNAHTVWSGWTKTFCESIPPPRTGGRTHWRSLLCVLISCSSLWPMHLQICQSLLCTPGPWHIQLSPLSVCCCHTRNLQESGQSGVALFSRVPALWSYCSAVFGWVKALCVSWCISVCFVLYLDL